jgi:hypothetical protein
LREAELPISSAFSSSSSLTSFILRFEDKAVEALG